MGVSGCERVSAPGSESIALGHALVCPGVSLGGDQLGGLPAWGPLGLNLLSGCRVCAQSYQQRSVSAQETHTHTHTRVHKRYICRTVAHWRFYARDLLLALGGPALGGSGRGSGRWGPRPNAGSPWPQSQRWRRVHKPPEVPPCKDQRARQQACLPFVTATRQSPSQPASQPAR